MDSKVLRVIEELMDQLQGEMEYDDKDLASRLGKEKPAVAVLKVEKKPMEGGEMEMMEGEEESESYGGMEDEEYEEECSPEDSLKKRLMRLRG